MQTRRDQLQAYRFVTRRVMAALLHGEPDTPESPMRKLAVATFSGVMVAVLGIAAFGVWGLLRPGGSQSVEDPAALIVEKETGSRYVFNENDHKLYPVLNYTSARLILDSSSISLHRVSHKSLTKYRRGPTLGIPGAPDALPDDKALIRRPWTVCSRVEQSASGNPRPIVTLLAGREPGGQAFGDNEFVVVKVAGQAWVVWHNQRLRASSTAIGVLPTQQQPLVGAAWLNALPPGPDFEAPRVPDLGARTGYQVNGRITNVGQVFRNDVVGGASKWYVALRDGLAPLLETEASLLLADPATRVAYGGRGATPIQIDTATAATAPQSATSLSNPDLPHTLPTPAALPDGDTTPLCVTYPDPKGEPTTVRVTQGGDVPTAAEQNDGQIPLGAVTNTTAVDQVVLPPGGGALVGLVPGSGQDGDIQTYYLLTDQGLKFPIKSADLVDKLGYHTSSAVPLPPNLLRLIPDGPTLDTEAARKPVQVIPQQQSSIPALPLK
jgi:type VII secretion protein EccB